MWEWLRGLFARRALGNFISQLIEPQALAVALTETVAEYTHAVEQGKVSWPAHKRDGASAVEIWSDLRMEAFAQMYNFGRADLMLLADLRYQTEVFDSFLVDRPYLAVVQPRGEPVADTIQAVWRTYMYLSRVGSEVGDQTTDREYLRLKSLQILDRLNSDASKLQPQWNAFRAKKSGIWSRQRRSIPEAFFLNILYDDITAKTKSIALTAKFGPNQAAGMKWLREQVLKGNPSESELANFDATIQRVLNAKIPEEARAAQ